MLAIDREVLGAEHPEVAGSLQWLGEVYAERDDFVAARKALQEALAIEMKLHGEKHWRVTDVRWALARVERLATLDPDQRRRLAEANQLNQRVAELSAQAKFREALELAQKALVIHQHLPEEGQPDHALSLNHLALSLNNLGMLYRAMGDYARAEPLLRQALEIRKKALAPTPWCARPVLTRPSVPAPAAESWEVRGSAAISSVPHFHAPPPMRPTTEPPATSNSSLDPCNAPTPTSR
jgi:tetratricopeptide (TPR) repeat protein